MYSVELLYYINNISKL